MRGFYFFCLSALFPFHIKAQQLPDYTLQSLGNNKTVSLSDFQSKKAIVVIFTSNHCPYAKLYDDRLENLHAQFSNKGVQFLAVNANIKTGHKKDHIPELEKMWAAKEKKSFPYLLDTDQKLLKATGTKKNPEAIILIPKNGKFQVVYQGTIDDNPQMPQQVTQAYLEIALDLILQNKPLPSSNPTAAGCMIRILAP